MRRKCEEQNAIISQKNRELKDLRQKLDASMTEDSTTPEKEAVAILMEMGTTHTQERTDALLPLVETVKQVCTASTKVKKKIFSKKCGTKKDQKLRRLHPL